jgi:uncharacterized membrane protein YagU involved in acid resistance
MAKENAIRTIACAGLLAGCMDLAAAIITTLVRGGSPARMLRTIASGLLGAASFQGGWKTSALGVVLHFVIAFGATTVFYIASRYLKSLTREPIRAGLLYGVAVYFFMQLVVLPLSRLPNFKPSFKPSILIVGLLVHIFCVGLPIALVVRHFARKELAP